MVKFNRPTQSVIVTVYVYFLFLALIFLFFLESHNFYHFLRLKSDFLNIDQLFLFLIQRQILFPRHHLPVPSGLPGDPLAHARGRLAEERQHVSAANYVESFEKVVMLDRAANKSLFSAERIRLIETLERHREFLTAVGMIDLELDVADILDPSVVMPN